MGFWRAPGGLATQARVKGSEFNHIRLTQTLCLFGHQGIAARPGLIGLQCADQIPALLTGEARPHGSVADAFGAVAIGAGRGFHPALSRINWLRCLWNAGRGELGGVRVVTDNALLPRRVTAYLDLLLRRGPPRHFLVAEGAK